MQISGQVSSVESYHLIDYKGQEMASFSNSTKNVTLLSRTEYIATSK